MHILCIGDVVGQPGRRAIRRLLPSLREQWDLDLVIANGENAAGGYGMTLEVAQELLDLGIDVLTTGNHVWDKKEALDFITDMPMVLRPANYPPGTPGRGHCLVRSSGGVLFGVVNLSGLVFMDPLDCPFRKGEELVAELLQSTPLVVVDFHAEATSEKQAFARLMDGRCTAVVGTHTHVATADAQILPGGTAYITDLGMTGVEDSILGMETGTALRRFLTHLPVRLEVARGVASVRGLVIEADAATGRACRAAPVFVKEACA
ncbi:MAG: TIGR00282 family metallophosphoesterase [Firmicutes bacterium]|nr:TIGR00282 family metallophosphoesterase [Bacillota bacterium]